MRYFYWFYRNKKRSQREYYTTVWQKFDFLDKMDKFLQVYNVPSLNHEKTEKLNRPKTRKKI